MRPLLLIAALAAIVAGTSTAPATASAPRVLWVGAPPATVQAGAPLRVRVLTRPPTATVRVLLSRDRRADRRDRRLGTARPRHRGVTVVVPRSTTPGRYLVLVCLRGRCRTSTRRVRIVPRPTAGTPPAPAPAAPPASPIPPVPGPDPYAGLPSLAGPADPVTIHPWPPAGAELSTRIGPGGGRIQGRTTDGSDFDLVIPPGALLSRQRVTVREILEIPDLPFTTAAAAAVAITPDGLVLQRPATLRIVPSHAAPPGEQVGFAWRGEGHDLHAVPIGTDPAAVTLHLWSLSGAGVAGGSAAEQAAQQQRRPHMVIDRLQQQQAAATDFQRRTGIAPSREATAAWLRRAFDDAVLPALDAAAADLTRMADAGLGLSWWTAASGARALPGAIDPSLADRFGTARARFAPVVADVYDAARAACAAGDTPTNVPHLHQMAALQQTLGLEPADAARDARACSELAVTLDEVIEQEGDRAYTARWGMTPFVMMNADPRGELLVSTTLVDGGWTAGPTWGELPATAGPTDAGRPVLAGLAIDVDARVRLDPGGTVRDDDGPIRLSLRLADADPVNHVLVTSPGGTTSDLPFEPFSSAWAFFRGHDEDAADRVPALDFEATGGSPLADETRTWVANGNLTDTIHIVVKPAHAP